MKVLQIISVYFATAHMNKGKGIQTREYPTAFWPVQSTERTGTSSKATFACLGLIAVPFI